jgi:N-acetylmuramoyl-L-alanine amidase
VRRGPVVVGTAAAVWMSGSAARAGVHVVRRGETLGGIAARYGTTVEVLAEANGLTDPGFIVAGQRLAVPGRATASSVHVVQPGETLSAIAARYHTTVAALARANRIRDVNLIVAGTHLRIAGAMDASAAGPAASSAGRTATSSVGTALEVTARRRGVDPSLVKAVAWQESRWNQEAISSAGAIGVMQVMPGTARYLNDKLPGRKLDVHTAGDNVALGVSYLDELLETMPSEEKALAAYLSGPASVGSKLERYQRRYVRRVEALKPGF